MWLLFCPQSSIFFRFGSISLDELVEYILLWLIIIKNRNEKNETLKKSLPLVLRSWDGEVPDVLGGGLGVQINDKMEDREDKVAGRESEEVYVLEGIG